MAEPQRCPECGAEVGPNAPDGACLVCAFKGALLPVSEARTDSEVLAEPSPPMDARIHYSGDCQLLQEIARGGMGVVYRARQVSLDRIVALKMILAGRLASEADVQRFQHEAKSAASLAHANIVRIHEIGEHDGQHYYSMDFVQGQNLGQMVRQRPLPAQRAAQYLKTIAEAIHVAHQKGTIHRDLKPTNVLIDEFDQPRITDFGLAHREKLDQRLTTTGQILGTPAFMAPEQATGRTEEVGPETDVYSAGAVLYFLLTQKAPFTAESLPALLAQVCGAEAPVSPRALNPGVPRDLETICLKCLEKDTAHRYPSAQRLAGALGRLCRNEPILARPPSVAEETWHWCARNRGLSGSLAALTLVVAAGVIGITWQAFRATRAESVAQQRLTESEAITKFLTGVFQSPDPARDGRTITVAETLDAATKKLETDLASQPARRAQLQRTLASTYLALGLPREAIPLDEKARDYYRAASGPEHPDTLGAMHNLAASYSDAGRWDEALKLEEEVLTLSRRVKGPEHPDTLSAMNNLAISYAEAGRQDEALKLEEEVLTLSRRVNGPKHPGTLRAMSNLASSYADAGRQDDALKLREEVLTLSRKVNGPEDPDTLRAMSNLAGSYAKAGRWDEALKLCEELLPLRRKVLGPEHPRTLDAMINLAASYRGANRADEAIKMGQSSLGLFRQISGLTNANTLNAMTELAISYQVARHIGEAIALEEESLRLKRQHLPPGDPLTVESIENLATCYEQSNRKPEAEALRRELAELKAKVGYK